MRNSHQLPVLPENRNLFHVLLVALDHVLDHLAAHAAGFLRSKIAVVALLQVHANLRSGFHLELIQRCTGPRNNILISRPNLLLSLYI